MFCMSSLNMHVHYVSECCLIVNTLCHYTDKMRREDGTQLRGLCILACPVLRAVMYTLRGPTPAE